MNLFGLRAERAERGLPQPGRVDCRVVRDRVRPARRQGSYIKLCQLHQPISRPGGRAYKPGLGWLRCYGEEMVLLLFVALSLPQGCHRGQGGGG